MTRRSPAFLGAVLLGVSAFALSACGRMPTEPALISTAHASATKDEAADKSHAVSLREQQLAAREAALKAQQDELRRQREALAAERTLASAAFDADQATSAAVATPVSSVQKVPTPPIVVPPGTPLSIALTANVNTRIARVGDAVEGRLASDLMIEDRRAAFAGAAVTGKVTKLESGHDTVGDVPTLGLTFESLAAANGATIPIVAHYTRQGTGDMDRDAPRNMGGDVKLRAGTVITASTETSFSIY